MSFSEVYRRLVSAGLLLAVVAAVSACATDYRREAKFEQAQLKYTQLVRWSAFGEAKEYVAAEERKAFQQDIDKLGGVRFMDYRIEWLEFDAEDNEASALVVYSAYRRAAVSAISVAEEQEWKRDDETKEWKVKSTFVEKAFDSERRD